MACFDSVSIFPPDEEEHDRLTIAMRDILERTRVLVGSDEGVIAVTSGSTESIGMVVHPACSVVASFLEPESVTSLPECSVVPIRKSGARAWNTYLTDPDKFSHAYISVVNEEYGVVSDLPGTSSMIKGISPETVVIADMSYAMDPSYFANISADTDIVLFDGSFCGAPHVGIIWSKDPENIRSNETAGRQQFGLRPGYLHSAPCGTLSAGIQAVLGMQDEDVGRVREMRTKLESRMMEIPGVYLNFQEAPRAEHTVNLHIEGVWTRPLVLALRKLGISVSDTIDGLRNTHLCTPLTSYMFEETARHSNLLFRVGRHTSAEDIDTAVEYTKKAISLVREAFPTPREDVIVQP